MTRNFSIFCVLVIATGLRSQTLTVNNNAFIAGDVVVKQQVEYKDPLAFGHGILWDFSALSPINTEYKVKYFYPDSTDLTLYCGQEPTARFYYRLRNDSLFATGFENSTSIMKYSKPELKLKFPMNYGDTLYSVFEGNGQYGRRVPMYVKGFTRVKYDADGTLFLPDFPNGVPAFRTHTLRYYTQATRNKIKMKIDTYSWYVAGTRYPVFESVKTSVITVTTFDNGSEQQKDTAIFQTSFYYPPNEQTGTGSGNGQNTDGQNQVLTGINAVFTEATYLPNPVYDNLYINYKLTRDATVWFSVHSNGGIPLCQTSPQHRQAGYNEAIVPMNSLIHGTYAVYVHVDDMVMMVNIIKN